jgi:NAD(P)-dependent dehydrogenase (short-subunit alcohol dehydrogenase family)
MSKDTISKNYIEKQKASHVTADILPLHRRAVVFGAEEGNIGGSIAAKLKEDGFEVVCFCKGKLNLATDDRDLLDWGHFDTVVFCNGRTHLAWIEDQPDEEIAEVISDSLLSSIYGARSFVRGNLYSPYRKQIVFIGSMAYKAVLNGSSPYCAAKAGLAHFARCLAWELAPKGFDVFCVHPSNTLGTPMTEETIKGLMRYRGLDREEAEAYWGAVLPKKQWLLPENIADLVSFLVSGKAEYLSGANLDMAGGQR